MININIPFDFKEKVYYISLNWFTYCVSEGEVFGIHVYNRKGKLSVRTNKQSLYNNKFIYENVLTSLLCVNYNKITQTKQGR